MKHKITVNGGGNGMKQIYDTVLVFPLLGGGVFCWGIFLEIVRFVLFRGDFNFKLIQNIHFFKFDTYTLDKYQNCLYRLCNDLNDTELLNWLYQNYIKLSRSSVPPFCKSMDPIFFYQVTNRRCSAVGQSGRLDVRIPVLKTGREVPLPNARQYL